MIARIVALFLALTLLLAPTATGRAETPNLPHQVFLPRIVTPLPEVLFEAVPPDSTTLQIFKARIDGSERVMLTQPSQGRNSSARSSPDHSRIVFSSNRDTTDPTHGSEYLYLMNADGSNQRRLTSAVGETEHHPVWSPDSSHLAFNRGQQLYVIQADGSNEHLLATAWSTQVHWSPDAQHLTFLQDGVLHIINADGRGDRVIADKSTGGVWSPDGAKLLYSTLPDGQSGSRLATVSADGGTTQVLTDTNLLITYLLWSPSGDYIAAQGELWLGGSLQGSSAVVMHSDGSAAVELPQSTALSGWSPDGKRIVYTTNTALLVADRTGTVIATLNTTSGLSSQRGSASWSPDGAWVSFILLTSFGHLMQATDAVIVSSDGTTRFQPDEGLTGTNLVSWR